MMIYLTLDVSTHFLNSRLAHRSGKVIILPLELLTE